MAKAGGPSRSPDAGKVLPSPVRGRGVGDEAQERALERGTLEHYLDPELYDHEYRRRRGDLPFYRAMVATRGADVLELGCGSGRLTIPLLRDGNRVTGLDRAQTMLRANAARIARLSAIHRSRAQLVRADFREFAFSRRWPIIICPFNAMMHLYTRGDMARFLATVADHLEPRGLFCFDVQNPDLRWLTRDPNRRWSRTRFKDPRTGATYYYSTNHTYDAATQITWIRLYYERADRPAPIEGADLPDAGGERAVIRTRVVQLTQRQFFPEELLTYLEIAGFTVERREGGFAGEPFTAEAESQVCTCSIRR